MDEIYSVILVDATWMVYRDDGDEPVHACSSEQDAVDWCVADASGDEPRIRVYQGEVCGP